MSEDRPGSPLPEGRLSEEQVARLLGAAGPVGPTPPDVVDRMDAVLSDLVAERSAAGGVPVPGPGPGRADVADPEPGVVSLDAERSRRRRWGTRLLVAATVLGVTGIGLSVADDLTGGSGSESASAGDAAGAQAESGDAGGSSGSSGSEESGGSVESGGDGGGGADRDNQDRSEADAPQPDVAAELSRAAKASRPVITDEAGLRAAVRRTARGDLAALGESGYQAGDGSAAARGELSSERCVTPGGPGRRALVSYRGDPATLVVRRTGDRLDGRVYDCRLGLQLDGVEIGPAGE